MTGFIPAGVDALWTLLRTGHVARPGVLLVLVGAVGHFLMILGCLVCFLRRHPKLRQWAEFLGGAVLAVAALALISPLRHHEQALPLDIVGGLLCGREPLDAQRGVHLLDPRHDLPSRPPSRPRDS